MLVLNSKGSAFLLSDEIVRSLKPEQTLEIEFRSLIRHSNIIEVLDSL